ncbi:MAG: hypothetical protein ACI88G_002034 [Woeseiaceae bacterium]
MQSISPAYSPIWSCSGRGLPCRGVLPPARCALTAPFHPYLGLRSGGIFSVALSMGSHPPGVTWRPALRSPDFPPHCKKQCGGCLADSYFLRLRSVAHGTINSHKPSRYLTDRCKTLVPGAHSHGRACNRHYYAIANSRRGVTGKVLPERLDILP